MRAGLQEILDLEQVELYVFRGRTREVRTRPAGGGFVVAYRGWLEDTEIEVRIPGGPGELTLIRRATLRRNEAGRYYVDQPPTAALARYPTR